MIGNCFPAVIDNCLRDCFLNGARTLDCRRASDDGRRHFNDFSSDNRARVFRRDIDCHVALEPEPFDRLLSSRAEFVVTGAAIHNRGVVVGNVGHVGCLIDDGDVALDRNQRALNALRAEFFCRHETILVRADVVIIIGPILNSGAAIETRFGRERGPTDVIITLAPGNPSWRPFVAWDPDPADIAKTCPTSVMISRPAKRLFRDPCPAGVRVNPAAIGVGTPAARLLGLARLPDVAVGSGFAPNTERFQVRIEG